MWRAALVGVTGCSFAFTNAPGPASPGELPVCTTSYAPVVADGVGAVPVLVVAGTLAVGALNGTSDPIAERIAGAAFVVGAVLVAAAFYGARNVARCDHAIDDTFAALARAADAGTCEPVVAFAKRLAHRDPNAAIVFVADATFARCFN